MDADAVVATAGDEANEAQSERQAKKGAYFGTSAANARATAHIIGRPGPKEPSGFLVVPGRAKGVRGRACDEADACTAAC